MRSGSSQQNYVENWEIKAMHGCNKRTAKEAYAHYWAAVAAIFRIWRNNYFRIWLIQIRNLMFDAPLNALTMGILCECLWTMDSSRAHTHIHIVRKCNLKCIFFKRASEINICCVSVHLKLLSKSKHRAYKKQWQWQRRRMQKSTAMTTPFWKITASCAQCCCYYYSGCYPHYVPSGPHTHTHEIYC